MASEMTGEMELLAAAAVDPGPEDGPAFEAALAFCQGKITAAEYAELAGELAAGNTDGAAAHGGHGSQASHGRGPRFTDGREHGSPAGQQGLRGSPARA